MRLKGLITILFALLGTACSQPNSLLKDKEGIEKERLADSVLDRVASQLKQEANLRPCGTIGQMMNEIQILGLAFYYYQPIDIVEGRKLLVKAVEAMLQEINQNTKIRSYLVRYPFKPRNVEIQIFLRNPDGRDVAPGALDVIDAGEGFLQYQIHNPTGYGLITVYRETYEEALERIADPTLPLVPFQPDPKISQEELTRLRKGVSFVSDDGSIWHLGEDGCWVKNQDKKAK